MNGRGALVRAIGARAAQRLALVLLVPALLGPAAPVRAASVEVGVEVELDLPRAREIPWVWTESDLLEARERIREELLPLLAREFRHWTFARCGECAGYRLTARVARSAAGAVTLSFAPAYAPGAGALGPLPVLGASGSLALRSPTPEIVAEHIRDAVREAWLDPRSRTVLLDWLKRVPLGERVGWMEGDAAVPLPIDSGLDAERHADLLYASFRIEAVREHDGVREVGHVLEAHNLGRIVYGSGAGGSATGAPGTIVLGPSAHLRANVLERLDADALADEGTVAAMRALELGRIRLWKLDALPDEIPVVAR